MFLYSMSLALVVSFIMILVFGDLKLYISEAEMYDFLAHQKRSYEPKVLSPPPIPCVVINGIDLGRTRLFTRTAFDTYLARS